MELGKVPPHDTEAEQAVIGSMLTDKEAIIAALEILKEDDFYREDNKTIYEAITNLYNRAEPVDIITLKAELSSMGKLEAVGGLEYLAELPDKVPTTSNVEKYIKIVEEKSLLRSLIKTANDIIKLGYDETQEVEVLMDQAEQRIFNTIQSKNTWNYNPKSSSQTINSYNIKANEDKAIIQYHFVDDDKIEYTMEEILKFEYNGDEPVISSAIHSSLRDANGEPLNTVIQRNDCDIDEKTWNFLHQAIFRK